MKKITFLLLLVLFKMSAQDSKISVGVMAFVSSEKENASRASQLQEIVIEVLSLKTNIEPIDRSKDALLNQELDVQINERSIASKKLVEQGKKIGANNLIIGTLTSIEVNEEKTSIGKLSGLVGGFGGNTSNFKANISFSLQIIDVETGKIISHKAFNKTADNVGVSIPILGSGNSKEKAIVNAMDDSKKKILSWLNEVYPSLIKILKIEERTKSGKPKTILVTGVDSSLKEGSKLILEEIELISSGIGTEPLRRYKKIASLVLKEKQGDITVCKISEGEDIIEEKMTNGSKLNIKVQ
jgi:curli biogenesis system outer membrane secretion channel CsgG